MPEKPELPDEDPVLVARIAADLAAIRWLPPDEIRSRAGRRKRRRTTTGVVAVMVAVATASAVGPLARPDGVPWASLAGTAAPPPRSSVPPIHPTVGLASPAIPPARPSATPAGSVVPFARTGSALPTTQLADPATPIPPEALLQPGDVGDGLLLGLADVSDFAPVRPIAASLASCSAYQRMERYDGVAVALRRHAILRAPDDGEPVLRQEVRRLPGGMAGRVVEDAGEAVAVCTRYRSSAQATAEERQLDGVGDHAWSRVDQDFAGEQSMLLRHEVTDQKSPAAPRVYLVVVVRVGDLVAVVTLADDTRDRARALATTAAARLCRGANPRC